jgi:hypothetical protein
MRGQLGESVGGSVLPCQHQGVSRPRCVSFLFFFLPCSVLFSHTPYTPPVASDCRARAGAVLSGSTAQARFAQRSCAAASVHKPHTRACPPRICRRRRAARLGGRRWAGPPSTLEARPEACLAVTRRRHAAMRGRAAGRAAARAPAASAPRRAPARPRRGDLYEADDAEDDGRDTRARRADAAAAPDAAAALEELPADIRPICFYRCTGHRPIDRELVLLPKGCRGVQLRTRLGCH